DAPLEERRARAVEMRRILPESVLEEVGKLDPAAIQQVREEAWPDIRDADELHDVLHTLVVVPEDALVRGEADEPSAPLGTSSPASGALQFYFERLADQNRVIKTFVRDQAYWIASERASFFSALFPEANLVSDRENNPLNAEDVLLFTVTG